MARKNHLVTFMTLLSCSACGASTNLTGSGQNQNSGHSPAQLAALSTAKNQPRSGTVNMLPANIADAGDPNGSIAGFYVGNNTNGDNDPADGDMHLTTSEAWSGSYSVQWKGQDKDQEHCGGVKFIAPLMQVGTTYTFSLYARSVPTAENPNAQSAFELWLVSANSHQGFATGEQVQYPTVWNRYSLTFSPRADDPQPYEVQVLNWICGEAYQWYMDGLQLEEGSSPSDWVPGQ